MRLLDHLKDLPKIHLPIKQPKPHHLDRRRPPRKLLKIRLTQPNLLLHHLPRRLLRIQTLELQIYFRITLHPNTLNKPRQHLVRTFLEKDRLQTFERSLLTQPMLQHNLSLQSEDSHNLSDISIISIHKKRRPCDLLPKIIKIKIYASCLGPPSLFSIFFSGRSTRSVRSGRSPRSGPPTLLIGGPPGPRRPGRAFLFSSARFFRAISCSPCHFWNFSIAAASSNKPNLTPRNKCFRYNTPLYERMRRTVSVGWAPLCSQSSAFWRSS